MSKKKKFRITRADYLKMQRKASREEEIKAYGKPITYNRVEVSKKSYNRQRGKESLRRERVQNEAD